MPRPGYTQQHVQVLLVVCDQCNSNKDELGVSGLRPVMWSVLCLGLLSSQVCTEHTRKLGAFSGNLHTEIDMTATKDQLRGNR